MSPRLMTLSSDGSSAGNQALLANLRTELRAANGKLEAAWAEYNAKKTVFDGVQAVVEALAALIELERSSAEIAP